MKYTLMTGEKVENLRYCATGVGVWEQSQYFWYNGKKVCEMYNSETGEVKLLDANGDEVLIF